VLSNSLTSLLEPNENSSEGAYGLAIYMKKYLKKAKEARIMETLKYFTMPKST
jgi:hypothetical protein